MSGDHTKKILSLTYHNIETLVDHDDDLEALFAPTTVPRCTALRLHLLLTNPEGWIDLDRLYSIVGSLTE